MMMFWGCAFTMVSVVSSAGFLSAQVDKKDVEQALLDEMATMSSSPRFAKVQAEFSTFFAALPKNQHGNLDNPTVRYAIHRYFSKNFGWQVKGLSSGGNTWNASSSTGFMKSRVSAYIFELFEKQLEGKGFDLRNLAVFASVMEDLVNQEAMNIVDRVFELLKLSPTGSVPTSDVDRVIAVFNAACMIGEFTLDDMKDIEFIETEVHQVYLRWDNTVMWMIDTRHTYDWLNIPHRNPFKGQEYTYRDVAEIAKKVMYSLGDFESAECKSVKDVMTEMDPHAIGRVPLADYYQNPQIDFHESTEFLRKVGALDESNPSLPSIIIPNYMGMSGNCAMAVEYYSLCCFDECEGLMQKIEQVIGAPSASPARLASVISNIASDSVEAPRNLSSLLLTRLGQIADVHGGEVFLHGRLFMQLMHHAYPRECVFPHVAGTTNPDAEWEEVTDDDKAKHAVRTPLQQTITKEESINALPWSTVEELVAGHRRKHEPAPGMLKKLRYIIGVVALLSLMVPLFHSSSKIACTSPDKALCV